MSSREQRTTSIVKEAIEAFGHGVPAAEWLGVVNPVFGNRAPLEVARESEEAYARVSRVIGAICVARKN